MESFLVIPIIGIMLAVGRILLANKIPNPHDVDSIVVKDSKLFIELMNIWKRLLHFKCYGWRQL